MSAAPTNYPGSGTQSGPKKETARISILPEPAAPPGATVKMAKTQPLLSTPLKVRSVPAPITKAALPTPAAPVVPAARGTLDLLDAVPVPIAWAICGISALILLIQIWNYLA
ncbi:MAG: hypothetical protein ACR2ID_09610 [Chthoniobacterales bacterium]